MTDGPFDERDRAWPASGGGARVAVQRPSEAGPMRALASIGFVLDATRRRRSGRIGLWALVVALFVSGVGLLMFPVVTDVWAGNIQDRLKTQFKQLSGNTNAANIAEGAALTRLVIPKIKVDVIVVQGTGSNALRAGAGHYIQSALPGDPTGNVAIAGHRTGYGHPFRHLDAMKPGDLLYLYTPRGTYTYRTVPPFDGHKNPWVVSPFDWSVINPTAKPSLTLTTCNPVHQATTRLVLRAILVRGPGA
jgi:LPXTG-site transpeptidase (sortase) family protein